ncbi:MAG: hypothetical protein ACJAWP_000449 [Porticoccus sp.]|jgi:hypothetical protein|uniref:hypothetical protein n=1 Tax=Porticoccus sp. TaxID=2024853 RepID=UPI0039E41586|tara:strand:- start:166 stop:762 length:597 start_codon:yes stop_codon:yes gene_type:complete
MKASEILQTIKSTIASSKENDVQQISIESLEAYIARLEEMANKTPEDVAAGEAAMAAYKADLNSWVASRQQRHEFDLEMLRATITTGQSALKSSLLINGGAAVAMLAFAGNIWGRREKYESLFCLIPDSLACFVYGVLSAAVAAGFSYFSQAGYGGEFGRYSTKIGVAAHVVAILSVVASYVLFGKGAWLAYMAIGNG